MTVLTWLRVREKGLLAVVTKWICGSWLAGDGDGGRNYHEGPQKIPAPFPLQLPLTVAAFAAVFDWLDWPDYFWEDCWWMNLGSKR